MKGPSTLLVALALAALLILEPTANAAVHRLSPTLTRQPLKSSPANTPNKAKEIMSPMDRLTSFHGLEINMAREQRRLQQQKTTTDSSCDSGNPTISNGQRVNISVEYGLTMVAEMNIGSPAQGPFEMELTFNGRQPYVLKKGAKYSDDGSKVRNVQEFDKKASNTSSQMNADFTSFYVYLTGSVVADTLQIGSLSTNQSVQVTKKVDPQFNYYFTDGSLGLGMSYDRDGSSFVEQLASQLDSPVLTLYANQSFSWVHEEDGEGVLSFGDRVPEICAASSWQKMSSWLSDWWSWPAVDIVSVTGPADANGCGGQVTANITIGFSHAFTPIYCSVQVQELFVQASGARWDWWYGYVVDDTSKAVSVNFNTADGQVIEITPNDYLLELDGTSILYTYGTYDQNIYAYSDYMVLPQTFLNNHCLSMDMTTGEWSLASVRSPSEAAIDSGSVGISDPSSSSSSSSSVEADYISRKH